MIWGHHPDLVRCKYPVNSIGKILGVGFSAAYKRIVCIRSKAFCCIELYFVTIVKVAS